MSTSASRLFLHCIITGAALSLGGAAMAADAAGMKTSIPRAADGKPDFSGFWTHETITPFERPAQYGTRLIMTPEEVHAAEKFAADHVQKSDEPTDPNTRV